MEEHDAAYILAQQRPGGFSSLRRSENGFTRENDIDPLSLETRQSLPRHLHADVVWVVGKSGHDHTDAHLLPPDSEHLSPALSYKERECGG